MLETVAINPGEPIMAKPEPRKRGRPKAESPRETVRMTVHLTPELARKWRAYVKRHTPPQYATPNMSVVFRDMLLAALEAEK